tara:strand:+ start:47 stop:355 length:309 start_codon:yes stop_codon:yes gene_type:complete
MGYKMKGPSLYKPKMADMDIQKKYDKKADDRPMSSPYQSNTGSDQEDDTKKKSTDTVVNSKTKVISSVATERLKKAGAPPEVIAASKAKFIKEQKAKKLNEA